MPEDQQDSSPADQTQKTPDQQLRFLCGLVDAAADAIVAYDPEGTLIFYNKTALELLGMSPDTMSTLGPFGWASPEYRTVAAERIEEILFEGGLTFDSVVVNAAGERVPVEVTANRLDTEDGPLVVAVLRDISEWAESQQRMRHLAYHDSLTGLHNRAYFEEELRRAIASARRHGDLLILAYLDLDHFKPVNDRHGHEAGDQVLREVASRLKEQVRVQDIVTRLGGDEFVVLLQRVDSCDQMGVIANRLLAAVREPIQIENGTTVSIDASLGFSVFNAATDDERSLVVKADIAMYAAKANMIASWLSYHPEMGMTPDQPRTKD